MRFERLPFSPQLIQARWVLGKLPSEDVPRLAQDALEIGFDGKNIRRIAGLLQPSEADLHPLMTGFFTELGVGTAPSGEEAGWMLARGVVEGILEARIAPYEGARFIGREIVLELWPNQDHPLRSFAAAAWDYEDCESYSEYPAKTRRQIEQAIIQAARAFLDQA
jgi:hypothetical protein